GLPDLVFKKVQVNTTQTSFTGAEISSPDTAFLVALNTGNGFLPAQQWTGAIPVPIQWRSGAHRNTGSHSSTTSGGEVTNPGHHSGNSISGSMAQVRDFDGDGYPDHICTPSPVTTITPPTPTCPAVNPTDIIVHLNQRGRTNLLQTITRPLGA